MLTYIITQWTRVEVSPTQMVLYKQAALSRSAPELPWSVREVIKQVFSDNAGPSLKKNMVGSLLCMRNHALDSAEPFISGKVRPRSKR